MPGRNCVPKSPVDMLAERTTTGWMANTVEGMGVVEFGNDGEPHLTVAVSNV